MFCKHENKAEAEQEERRYLQFSFMHFHLHLFHIRLRHILCTAFKRTQSQERQGCRDPSKRAAIGQLALSPVSFWWCSLTFYVFIPPVEITKTLWGWSNLVLTSVLSQFTPVINTYITGTNRHDVFYTKKGRTWCITFAEFTRRLE